ncbi:MAG: hypothetical protein ACOC25_04475 [Alkalispirochaetaceae bacterium]
MRDEAREALRERLRESARTLARSISIYPVDEVPADLDQLYRLPAPEGTLYLLLAAEPTSALSAWLRKAGAEAWRPGGEAAAPLLLEYLFAEERGSGPKERFVLSAHEGEEKSDGYLLYTSAGEQTRLTTDDPADLIAGRALLDEALLEGETGMSWLLVRCERVGFASAKETTKLLGALPDSARIEETGKSRLLARGALDSVSEKSARRLRDALPELLARPGEESGAYLLLLFRATRGEAAGTLRSARLLLVAPISAAGRAQSDVFREIIFSLLSSHMTEDREAGLSWLRLLAPRRYQYLRPSSGAAYLYRSLRALSGDGVQRVMAELRREASAFRALGTLIATAPEFHARSLRHAFSPRQLELLLPRRPPKRGDYAGRLTALLDALRTLEEYAEANPTTPARPGIELFTRLARERYRRIRARMDASVSAGVFALLFDHARLSWLQRAWSRIHRREMVRALAFEPARVVERAGQLYTRRGRVLLREDAQAIARRAQEWDPSEVVSILRARQRLWPILIEQLFDGESLERYVAALIEGSDRGGLPAAVAALTLLRLEELRPGTVTPKLLLSSAARVAAEPGLDEESEPLLAGMAENPRLLRQGGSRFAWLLAHALERMGRPEIAAEALEVTLRQLAKGDLPPEEQRRAKRLGWKYRELTS